MALAWRLAQQQVHAGVAGRIGKEIGPLLVEPQHLTDDCVIVAGRCTVGNDLPGSVYPDHAAQRGHSFAQRIHQAASCRCRHGGIGLEQVDGLLRLERHVQTQVVRQFGRVFQTLVAQLGLGKAELREQLPQQQPEQNQGEQCQRTLDRPAQTGSGRLGRATR